MTSRAPGWRAVESPRSATPATEVRDALSAGLTAVGMQVTREGAQVDIRSLMRQSTPHAWCANLLMPGATDSPRNLLWDTVMPLVEVCSARLGGAYARRDLT